MPIVLDAEGCKFYIFTNDHPPPHVHIHVGDGRIDLYLNEDVTIKNVYNAKRNEIRKARRLAKANRSLLLAAWAMIQGS